ncbi:MAG: hypothetical protein Q4D80_06240, partial [Pseudomonadota bacterium]|nr:hypothetical protein [Pseudomonadota bacterium]
TLETNGKSGSKTCGKCVEAQCPSGYATRVDSCPIGYDFETNGKSGTKACGRCAATRCPEGYSTDTTSCPEGYILKADGRSGDKSCNKCEKEVNDYCIKFNFKCNGADCDEDILGNILIIMNTDESVNKPTKDGYQYCQSDDGVKSVVFDVKIDENSNIADNVYIEDLEENIIGGDFKPYTIDDEGYSEVFEYLKVKDDRENFISTSAFHCEEHENCVEWYEKNDTACYYGGAEEACRALEKDAKSITRTLNLHKDTGDVRCIYYAATCPHLPENKKLFNDCGYNCIKPGYSYDLWIASSDIRVTKADSLWSFYSEPHNLGEYSSNYNNDQFASDCIKEAYIISDASGEKYYLRQMTQEKADEMYNKTKSNFFNPAKDTVILSNCELKDTDRGTLYVYPNTTYQEFLVDGKDVNEKYPTLALYKSYYDIENQKVTFSYFKDGTCYNPSVTRLEEDITISSTYTSRGGYIFNTTEEENGWPCIVDLDYPISSNCHRTYPIGRQTRIKDKIYPYNVIHGNYHTEETEYVSHILNMPTSQATMYEEYYELSATRPLPKTLNSLRPELRFYATGGKSEYSGCHFGSFLNNVNFPITFPERYETYHYVKQKYLDEVCNMPHSVHDSNMGTTFSGSCGRATSKLFDFGIIEDDDYLFISR